MHEELKMQEKVSKALEENRKSMAQLRTAEWELGFIDGVREEKSRARAEVKVMKSKEVPSGLVSALKVMRNSIVYSCRDWSVLSSDAWLYGMIVGWDAESLIDIAVKFRWSAAQISTLRSHRESVRQVENIG